MRRWAAAATRGWCVRLLAISALLIPGACTGLDGDSPGLFLQPQTVEGPCRVERFFLLRLRSVPATMVVENTGEPCVFTLLNLNLQAVLTAALVTGQPAYGRAEVARIVANRRAAVAYTPAPGYAGPDQFSITLQPRATGVTVNVTVVPPSGSAPL